MISHGSHFQRENCNLLILVPNWTHGICETRAGGVSKNESDWGVKLGLNWSQHYISQKICLIYSKPDYTCIWTLFTSNADHSILWNSESSQKACDTKLWCSEKSYSFVGLRSEKKEKRNNSAWMSISVNASKAAPESGGLWKSLKDTTV